MTAIVVVMVTVSDKMALEISSEIFRSRCEVFDFGALAFFGGGNWVGAVGKSFGIVVGVVLGGDVSVVFG